MSSKKGLEALKVKFADIILHNGIDDETQYGDGYWIYLKAGHIWDSSTHFVHEYTIADCAKALRQVTSCDCNQCQTNTVIERESAARELYAQSIEYKVLRACEIMLDEANGLRDRLILAYLLNITTEELCTSAENYQYAVWRQWRDAKNDAEYKQKELGL